MAFPLTHSDDHFRGLANGHRIVAANVLLAATLLLLIVPVQAYGAGSRLGFARAVDCAGLLHGPQADQAGEPHTGYASFESAAIILGHKARLKRSQVKRAILASAGRSRRFSLPQRQSMVRQCQALGLSGRDYGSR